MIRSALMWSGGKDCSLALDRACAAGHGIERLLTFVDESSQRVRFHATSRTMIESQATSLQIPVQIQACTWDQMGVRLDAALAGLASEGFEAIVFGDIHLADVRQWYERRVTAAGLAHVEPLWGQPPLDLVSEFVERGGRAVITCVDLARLDRSWLGRLVDRDFIRDVIGAAVDACGENGEFHSYAFDGPSFARPVGWRSGEHHDEPGFVQLDLLPD